MRGSLLTCGSRYGQNRCKGWSVRRRAVLAVLALAGSALVLACGSAAAAVHAADAKTSSAPSLVNSCVKPTAKLRLACGYLSGPLGIVKVPASKLATSLSVPGVSTVDCFRLHGHWTVGAKLKRGFITATQYASDYAKAASHLRGALRKQARQEAALYKALARANSAHCGKLRFSFRHAVALELIRSSSDGSNLARSSTGGSSTTTTVAGWSSLEDVLGSGQLAAAISSGEANIYAVETGPDGMLYVFFNGPVSLNGPIANATPSQLCLLAEVDEATGSTGCIGSAALSVDTVAGSAQGPPLFFDSAGGVYFGVWDTVGGLGLVSVYRYFDGQTVQVTPEPGQQFLTAQIGQFVPFANGSAVVNTGGMLVFTGTGQSVDTDSGVWLMTPGAAGSAYTGTDLVPFAPPGPTQALWQFPDGNAYVTNLPAGNQTCLLGQISAETGQVNPDYCLDPDGQISEDDTALREALLVAGDTNEHLLSTTNGQEWFLGDDILAELYPVVQVFAVPPDTVTGIGAPGYVNYTTTTMAAGDDLLVDAVTDTSSGATGPEYLYDFNTDTDTWAELDGPDDSQFPTGIQWVSATVDSADNAYLIYGDSNPERNVNDPEVISVNRTTGAVKVLFSEQVNPAPDYEPWWGFTQQEVQYDSATDQITISGPYGHGVTLAPGTSSNPDGEYEQNIFTETIDAADGTATSQTNLVEYNGPEIQFLPLNSTVFSFLPW